MSECSSCSILSPTFGTLSGFKFSYSRGRVQWYVIVALICIFLVNTMLTTFSCVHWLFIHLPLWIVFPTILSIFQLNCLWVLYIPVISSLSYMCIAKIFPQPVPWIFICLTVCFNKQYYCFPWSSTYYFPFI